MVRPTVYGHMVNTVTRSSLAGKAEGHMREASVHATKADVSRLTHADTRVLHTCSRRRSARVLLPKCRALEKKSHGTIGERASVKINLNLDKGPLNLKRPLITGYISRDERETTPFIIMQRFKKVVRVWLKISG